MDLRRLAVRAVVVVLSASAVVAGLTGLFAAVALTTTWELPEPRPVRGPTELLDRDGRTLLRITSEVDRREVALDRVAPHAVAAIVTAEDARFREHDGVDPWSLVRAVATNVRTGSIAQGGSTLTQQYVKNAFVGDDRSLRRKVEEAVLAIQLERDLPKDEILARYLNTASFGGSIVGVEAAARHYFGVPAEELTAAQGATLAQLLPAPSRRNPRSDPDGALARRDALLERMGESGTLSASEVAAAQGEPLELAPRPRQSTDHPTFASYVRGQLEHALGPDAVTGGGLTVRTTLDRDVQVALDDAVEAVLPAERAGPVEAAAVALDPRTGAILGLHGGRETELGDLDLATMTRRQNGSALKPFVYAAALEEGLLRPEQRVPTPARTTISRCVDHDGGPITVRGGPGGSLTAAGALARSVNTSFQQLGCDLGGPRVVEQLQRMGVASEVTSEASVALGGSTFGASPLDLAAAYGTLANDGLRCPTHAVAEVRDADGRRVELGDGEVVLTPGHPRTPRTVDPALLDDRPDPLADRDESPCHAVVEARTAREVTEALVAAVTDGTGRDASLGDRPVAGKTGTTTDLKDAWFVGYTPQLVVAVWVGDPGREGPVQELRNVAGVPQVFGGTLPAAIFRHAAGTVLEGSDVVPFPRPQDAELADDGPRVGPPRPAPAPAAPDEPETTEPDPEPQPEPELEDPEVPSGQPEPPPEDAQPDPSTDGDEDGSDDDRCLLVFRC